MNGLQNIESGWSEDIVLLINVDGYLSRIQPLPQTGGSGEKN
jgi:hypothetical protein